MRLGVDTNVLIYAHLPGLPDHAQVREYLLQQIDSPAVTLCLTAAVLHEFIHIITDARRFEPPVSMSEAIALARRYLDRTNVELLAPDERAMALALDLMERHRLGRKRVADTLLAATLLSQGVVTLITCNPRDFVVFDQLTVVDPRTT